MDTRSLTITVAWLIFAAGVGWCGYMAGWHRAWYLHLKRAAVLREALAGLLGHPNLPAARARARRALWGETPR